MHEVHRLAEGLKHEPLPEADTAALTRRKVEPMVRGLFPPAEQDVVQALFPEHGSRRLPWWR